MEAIYEQKAEKMGRVLVRPACSDHSGADRTGTDQRDAQTNRVEDGGVSGRQGKEAVAVHAEEKTETIPAIGLRGAFLQSREAIWEAAGPLRTGRYRWPSK